MAYKTETRFVLHVKIGSRLAYVNFCLSLVSYSDKMRTLLREQFNSSPKNKILDLPNLKAFADYKISLAQTEKNVFKPLPNHKILDSGN